MTPSRKGKIKPVKSRMLLIRREKNQDECVGEGLQAKSVGKAFTMEYKASLLMIFFSVLFFLNTRSKPKKVSKTSEWVNYMKTRKQEVDEEDVLEQQMITDSSVVNDMQAPCSSPPSSMICVTLGFFFHSHSWGIFIDLTELNLYYTYIYILVYWLFLALYVDTLWLCLILSIFGMIRIMYCLFWYVVLILLWGV